MNTDQIEKWLRNPPALKTPEGLLERLTADIRLPRPEVGDVSWSAQTPWFKRWMPALSFIIIFLGCIVAIAVQTDMIAGLKQENEKIRMEQGNLEGLRAANAEFQRLHNENQELDRLRKDNLELNRLREEVAQLQSQIQDAAGLRAENARLKALIAANPAAADSGVDFFDGAKAKAERTMCVSHLKQIGLAARIWGNDHHDVYPTNFISMTNEMRTWKILQCPSDKSHSVTNWAEVAAGNISYVMDAPGIIENYPQVIFVECPIHHNICLVDGSVQSLSEQELKEHVKIVNGMKMFLPNQNNQ
jgi:hypothetical protein